MSQSVIRVAVTGGAGQIAYSLLFRIASGEVFGPEQPIILNIAEVPAALQQLEGVKMELDDCAFPLLHEVNIGSNPLQIFDGVRYAILVGAKPRGPGMERAELLAENGKIFVEQGQALNAVADRSVQVLVVGNPCNTNALIAMNHAPDLPRHHFFAMTRLDQNRAAVQLAQKAGVGIAAITQMTIWGNHSTTQVPDPYHALCSGCPVMEVIDEPIWFEAEWTPTVQKRGAAIIAARGKSSAASAANAVVDTLHSLMRPTPGGDWYSLALCSDGNGYGIADDLIFSFPCRTSSKGAVEVVGGLEWNVDLERRIRNSEQELIAEREMALRTTNWRA